MLHLAPFMLAAPNVVFVVSDDMGWNDVGFHGSEIRTPFLDSLALGPNSVHLASYYGQSICTPARSSMLTGRYASHTGMQHSYWIQGEAGGLPLTFNTLGDHFQAAGYHTVMVRPLFCVSVCARARVCGVRACGCRTVPRPFRWNSGG